MGFSRNSAKNSRLDIVFPNVFASCLRWQQETGDIERFSVFESFLNDARVTTWSAASHEALLFSLVAGHKADNVPVAALRQRSRQHPMVDSDSILCADPVCMNAGMHDLSITPVTLDDDELQPFTDLVNEHLKEYQLTFALNDNEAGLCWGFKDLEVNTVPLSIAQHAGLRAALPSGASAAALQSLSTEIQMLFFEAPFNQKRTAMGLPPVNGLWFWGSGVLPELKSRFQYLSGGKLVADLAQATAARYLNNNPEAFLAAALSDDFDSGLVELTGLNQSSDKDFSTVLAAYEQAFFMPLQELLKKNPNLEVRFFDDQQRCFTSQSRNWFSRFKKNKPLIDWIDSVELANE